MGSGFATIRELRRLIYCRTLPGLSKVCLILSQDLSTGKPVLSKRRLLRASSTGKNLRSSLYGRQARNNPMRSGLFSVALVSA
jgi:hypothetical protein